VHSCSTVASILTGITAAVHRPICTQSGLHVQRMEYLLFGHSRPCVLKLSVPASSQQKPLRRRLSGGADLQRTLEQDPLQLRRVRLLHSPACS
jgi:hypothetical protein